MTTAPRYPDLDPEISSYTAGILYIDGGRKLYFNGAHSTWAAARDRAKALHAALLAAGETGIKAHVSFNGERPEGFPHNGVSL